MYYYKNTIDNLLLWFYKEIVNSKLFLENMIICAVNNYILYIEIQKRENKILIIHLYKS